MKQSNPIHETMKINSALRDRKIHLSDEIDRESVFEVMYLMDRIKAIDDMAEISIDARKPIEIVISSYGGSIYDGLSLISKSEYFMDLGYIIITTVTGTAFSMGSAIALVANIRCSYRYARFMFHQPSSGVHGKLKDQKEDIAETEYLWIVMKDIIMKYTDFTEEMLDEIYEKKQDRYFSPQEMLELGVVDEII